MKPILSSLILLTGFWLSAHAQGLAFDEYQVKAAFLYNFARFVEWPQDAFASSTDPVEDMVRGKKFGDRAFVVRRLPDSQNFYNCHILFIGVAEWKRARAMPEELQRHGVLTVGEADDFTALGGIIGFKLEGARVRLQIALETADRAKLRISSKLLSLAEIVKKQP